MKKILLQVLLGTATAIVLTGCISLSSPSNQFSEHTDLQGSKIKHNIVYFAPEVYPDIEEIKFPSYQAFYNSISNKMSHYNQMRMTMIENFMAYDSVDVKIIKEVCENNNSDLAVVSQIKYFKVGIGKYVFSNQVLVSMKMFDSKGNLIKESSYDTFKKKKRMIGSTENSIKIGTDGVMNDILKEIRQLNRQAELLYDETNKELITGP